MKTYVPKLWVLSDTKYLTNKLTLWNVLVSKYEYFGANEFSLQMSNCIFFFFKSNNHQTRVDYSFPRKKVCVPNYMCIGGCTTSLVCYRKRNYNIKSFIKLYTHSCITQFITYHNPYWIFIHLSSPAMTS